ncbi:MAG: flagellar hook capping FlgD N-terminal domain-containing protein [Pseudomonadota bacterium]
MDFGAISNSVAKVATQASSNTSAEEVVESAADLAAEEQSEQFDTFLNLLTAQIQNQDPLAPIDSTQFVEQLATFSNLELQATTNQILEGISNLLASAIGEGGSLTTDSADS